MRRCIDSLLIKRNDIEIIIIDDCSSDNTFKIAKDYEKKYPSIVKVIKHEKNLGHGGGINTGIKHAEGKYIKVVDSDDWVDRLAYNKIIKKLVEFIKSDHNVDMLISNFVYEKKDAIHKKVMSYKKVFPQNKVFSWEEVCKFKCNQYILMHSVIYSRNMLLECNLMLPENMFYVDNIFVYKPLPYVKKMYYMDVDFYRYFIGREDQSVNEDIMIKRIDQQIFVNKLMMECADIEFIKNLKLQEYMLHYLKIITTVSTVLLLRSKSLKNLEKKDELWLYIKNRYPWIYQRINKHWLSAVVNLPYILIKDIVRIFYYISRKSIGFN
jgi:glycosyltransferase involved in cell wall biosynthesis